MYKFTYILISFFFFLILFSCNNGQEVYSIFTRESLQKIENKVETIERETIFKALGDTAFGTVRFGQDKETTISDIIKFQNQLQIGGTGFRFGNIFFEDMSEKVTDYETIPGQEVKSGLFIDYPVVFNKKLTSITWISSSMYETKISTVDKQLSDLVDLFKAKYGPPSIKYNKNNWWHYYGDNYYLGGYAAGWETSNNRVLIEIQSADSSIEPNGIFRYKIKVRFINIELNEILNDYQQSVKKNIQQGKREAELKENKRYIDAL